jgi:hypothetical protein
MTTVTILPDNPGSPDTRFRAVAGAAQSEGQTAGEALDALTQQLGGAGDGMLVVVRAVQPDEFFTAAQQAELGQLMTAWRQARDHGDSLSPEHQARLEQLVEAELVAASRRSAVASRDARP